MIALYFSNLPLNISVSYQEKCKQIKHVLSVEMGYFFILLFSLSKESDILSKNDLLEVLKLFHFYYRGLIFIHMWEFHICII